MSISRTEIQIKNGTHPIFVRNANTFEFHSIFLAAKAAEWRLA